MEKEIIIKELKRTQRDYTLSFKLSVVQLVESGELSIKGALRQYGIQSHGTVLNWIRRYGNFDRELQIKTAMSKSSDQVWVSDITYIGSRNRHNYLSLVTDAYSKKIVGYDLSDNLSAAGSLLPLRLALRGRKGSGELIHHSDRGVQYCCDEYQRELNAGGVTVSMTESYDPYANAIAERVNGILKDEFLLESYDVGLDVLSRVVTQSIDIYNNKRPHYSCALLTPAQMHLQSELPRAIYTKKIRSKPALAPENMLNNYIPKL